MGRWIPRAFLPLIVLSILGLTRPASSAPLRLAVGPYFASVSHQQLQTQCKLLPDLLASELGKSDAVELIEREKIHLLCQEWNLTSTGLTTREKTVHLGQALNCDRFASGSLAEVNGRVWVWTKLTDVRSGVILDLHATSYEGRDMSAAAKSIAAFLTRTREQSEARHYLALWPIADMNPAVKLKREDWGRRISSLIERHCLDAGIGVVEVDAIGALLDERRLQAAKLTGALDQQVPVQPAFWLVDGGWLDATNQMVVGLRLQRVGGPQELTWLTNAPGGPLESAIVAALGAGLRRTNEVTSSNPKADADLFAVRAKEMSFRQSQFWRQQVPARTRWDQYKQLLDDYQKADERQRAVTAAYERALLLDPENLLAKQQIGQAYLWEPDRRRWDQGVEFLRQVSAGNDPQLANSARITLENLQTIAEAAKTGASKPRRPDDWDSIQQAFAEEPDDAQAKFEFASHLYYRPGTNGSERARQLMASLAESGDAEFGPRAQKSLEQWTTWEKAAARAARKGQEARFDFIACRPYLQENFSKFVPVTFEKGSTGLARLQVLSGAGTFEYGGKYFYGFRFRIPRDLDGDFEWAFIIPQTEATRKYAGGGGDFFILPRTGSMEGFKTFRRLNLSRFPGLQEQFPDTKEVIYQTLSQSGLRPGDEYAIWFAFDAPNPPDIAFALSVDSEAGHHRFGRLPLE